MPLVSVVICTYNRASQLQRVLEDLAAQELPARFEWELIVVDNNSRDATQDLLRRLESQSTLPLRHFLERQQGKSYALNCGVRQARGELIAFTDDDVRIDSSWLSALYRASRDFDADVFAGRILEKWNTPVPKWYSQAGAYKFMDVLVRLDFGDSPAYIDKPAWGANMAVRRSAFARLGLFRSDLGPLGNVLRRGEDTEMCERVLAAGGRILYVPGAVVSHPVEPERATREYFLRWYHGFGQSAVQLYGIPEEAVRWAGIPRYLYRQLAQHAARWITAFDSRRRFHYKLWTYYTLGMMQQARASSGAMRRNEANRYVAVPPLE